VEDSCSDQLWAAGWVALAEEASEEAIAVEVEEDVKPV
jgi:hypothetical protein